jgi:predicted small secreted protein
MNIKSAKIFFLVLSAVMLSGFALTGCATTRNMQGKPIVSANVGKIINGTTTEPQIVSMFGPPYSIEKNPLSPGAVTYKYRFKYRKYVHLGNEILTASTKKYKEKLDVVIKNGIVISHSFTTTGNTSLKKILKKHNNY